MDTFLQTMKNRLLNQKQDLLKTLNSGNNELQEALLTDVGAEMGDMASADLDRHLMSALGQENLKALGKINGALARIANGSYGLCGQCSKPIDKGRLEAIPEAVFCLDCQSKTEKH